MKNIHIKPSISIRYNRITILVVIALFPVSLWALTPTSTMNYILTYTPDTAISDIDGNPESTTCPVIQYFDGLGRPIQTVAVGSNPQMKDLVTMTQFDVYGRESTTWLPVPNEGNGAFMSLTNVISSAGDVDAYPNEGKPYSLKVYEESPLNRIVKEYGPGQNWQNNNRGIVYDWGTNDLTTDYLKVRRFSVNSNNNNLESNELYQPGQLYVAKKIDEDGNNTWSFTDKLGRTILTRTYDGSDYVNTYYVYDDLNRLRYVLPPLASDAVDQGIGTFPISYDPLSQYAYYYRYDLCGNCIEKKFPGASSQYFVYDKADRLILSQDGNQRIKSQWTFSKYDVFGRLIMTGLVKLLSVTHQSLMDTYKNLIVTESYTGASACFGYTNNNAIGTYTMSELNYYDDYSYRTNSSIVPGNRYSTLAATSGTTLDAYYSSISAKGMLTGTIEFRLDGQGARKYTALYYDKKGRIVKKNIASFFNCFSNYTYGYEYYAYAYNFLGNVLQQHHTQSDIYNGTPIIEGTLFTYDNMGRCLSTKNYYGSISTIKAYTTNTYNALGQLDTKTYGNNLETQGYKYNVRGWLTEIIGNLFSEKLQYEKRRDSSTGLYNGNICESSWIYPTGAIHIPGWLTGPNWEGNVVNFSYTYDPLNRMTLGSKDNDYDGFMESLMYDKHGNITYLERNGIIEHSWDVNRSIPSHVVGKIDELSLTYHGNQLENVTDYSNNNQNFLGGQDFKDGEEDNENDYAYDDNGNMLRDINKNIVTMKYNYLNLPDTVQMKNANFVTYMWDGSGNKVRAWHRTYTGSLAIMPIGKTMVTNPISYTSGVGIYTDYFENFVYDNQCLRCYFFDDGIAINTNTSTIPTATPALVYNYYLKDHLGNNRVVFHAENNLPVIDQVNNYYPFGMEYGEEAEDTGETDFQNHLYNSKEFDDNFQMNSYDFGARTFCVDVPVWRTLDPLAEKDFSVSPYCFCMNNPMIFVDPNGMEWFYYSIDGRSDPTWNWRDEHEFHTGVKDANGKEVVLLGKEAVVTAEGSTDEKVGEGNNLFSSDSKLANFTVYGPNGKNDVKKYRGLTMTSDFSKYGAINNGEHKANWRDPGKTKAPYSHWAINNTDPVDCLYGTNSSPDGYSSTQKNGVYFHSTLSLNGRVGKRTSTGCMIIVPSGHGENGWDEFNAQLQTVSSFHFVLNRTAAIPYSSFQRFPLNSKNNLQNNIQWILKNIF